MIRSKPYGDNKDHPDSFTFNFCCDFFETFSMKEILLTVSRDLFFIFLHQINQIITPSNLYEKTLPNVLYILLVAVKFYPSPILLLTKAQLAVRLAN